jgi:hypothetical protein
VADRLPIPLAAGRGSADAADAAERWQAGAGDADGAAGEMDGTNCMARLQLAVKRLEMKRAELAAEASLLSLGAAFDTDDDAGLAPDP